MEPPHSGARRAKGAAFIDVKEQSPITSEDRGALLKDLSERLRELGEFL